MNNKADKPDESEVSAELARTIIVPPRGSSHGVIEAQYGALLARSEARERERALVYESSAAAATTTTEAEAILELEPVFTALEEPVLAVSEQIGLRPAGLARSLCG